MFVATKRDQEFPLSQRSNESNVVSNSNKFRQLTVTENCSNLTQIAPENPSDTSHQKYYTQKRDAGAEYLNRVTIVPGSYIGDINFMYPIKTR